MQEQTQQPRRRGAHLMTGLVISLIVLLCAAAAALYYYFVQEDIGYAAEDTLIVYGSGVCSAEHEPVLRDGELYLPVEFVQAFIDPYLFWEPSSNRLTVTTPTRVIRMRTDELTYYVNNDALALPLSAISINGNAYLPVKLLMELYHVEIAYHEDTRIATVDDLAVLRQHGQVDKATVLREAADKKSGGLQKLTPEDSFIVYDKTADFTAVRLANGLLGYLPTKAIVLTDVLGGVPAPEEPPLPPRTFTGNGKINLLWDQVTTAAASANAERRIAYKGLDVISPTWFSFDAETLNGDIVSIADKGYVDWAHENNLQVWALITDNFNEDVSHAILSDAEKREHVIRQLLALCATYELDGINIDFENVRAADSAYYIQFLRELAPFLKAQGAVLSVDMYVPKPFNLYYNRTEVAKAADYIIIMGYDEHYAGSPAAGPVASINFVHEGIVETLKEADKTQIILGMPYYVRVWREEMTAEGLSVTSRAYGMNYARQIFEEQNAEIMWDVETKTSYSEYTAEENGKTVRYRVWLEDELSIAEKLKFVTQYDLAGIAGWKKGLEKEEIWDLLYTYLQKSEGN